MLILVGLAALVIAFVAIRGIGQSGFRGGPFYQAQRKSREEKNKGE